MKHMNTYWIGGSPCCGKSSISERLVESFGFHYYKCDDNLERYLEVASKRNKKVSLKLKRSSIDEIFLRPVYEQVDDEITFYKEVFEQIIEDIKGLDNTQNVVIEGAALLPSCINALGISDSNYVCIVPTAEFQIEKYAERKWVDHYLRESKDKKRAYDNWMRRDVEFAKIVREDALDLGYKTIIVDGSESIEQNFEKVKSIFKLR